LETAAPPAAAASAVAVAAAVAVEVEVADELAPKLTTYATQQFTLS
jgi:hypothetical protein